MTLSERLDMIADVHTLWIVGELSAVEAFECIEAIMESVKELTIMDEV